MPRLGGLLLLRLTGRALSAGLGSLEATCPFFLSTTMLIPLITSAVRYANGSPYTIFNAVPTEEEGEGPDSAEFWYKVLLSVGLVLLGGVFAGYVYVAFYVIF